ncbi:uncharacterized protein [Polyergus mexicanus]|uniref:uncharacterized protein n=1 Tax=Polyergus mexicanus TaxID=615972 RepID=UPI0038B4DE80
MEVKSISHKVPLLLSKQEIQSEKITVPLDPVIPSVSSDLSSSSLKRQIQKSQEEDNSVPKKFNASRIIPDTVLNNRYTKSCQGPFEIVIMSTEAANTSIHPLTVGHLLSSTLKKDIEIKKLGFSKISAQFKSREAANNLINNPILNANNLIAYIPSYRVSRQGIIRNVPLDLTKSTIKEEIDFSVGINSVRRLNRKVIDPSTRLVSYAPSKSIAITFEGQNIPQSLYLYMVRYEVSLLISNPSLCYSCYRYGHIKSQCRGQSRCPLCGDKSHDNISSCSNNNQPPSCINCKGSHKINDRSCPEWLKQKNILELAAHKNIPIIEAKKIIRGNNTRTPNFFNFSNFPELNNSPTPDMLRGYIKWSFEPDFGKTDSDSVISSRSASENADTLR